MSSVNVTLKPRIDDAVAQKRLNFGAKGSRCIGRYRERHIFELSHVWIAILDRDPKAMLSGLVSAAAVVKITGENENGTGGHINRDAFSFLRLAIVRPAVTSRYDLGRPVLGGEIIHGFSMALIFGVLIGTYSSIYIASPVTLALGIKKEDLMPVKKEGEDLNKHP